MLTTEQDDVGFQGALIIVFELDEGTRGFAPLFVRTGDHCGLQYCRVTVENIFDFDGGYVLAARDDDVLEAVLDFDIAVRVPDRQVASVEPAAFERFTCGFGVL
ncbi:hypothetical protein D3C73_1251800 [compost metagenome]